MLKDAIIYGLKGKSLEVSLIACPFSRMGVVCPPCSPWDLPSHGSPGFAKAAPLQSSAFKLPQHYSLFLFSHFYRLIGFKTTPNFLLLKFWEG